MKKRKEVYTKQVKHKKVRWVCNKCPKSPVVRDRFQHSHENHIAGQ